MSKNRALLSSIIDKLDKPSKPKSTSVNNQTIANTGWLDRYEKGGESQDREMIEGVADMLKRVRSKSNRKEIAQYMMGNFEDEQVSYNPEEFMQLANVYRQGGQLPKYQDGSFTGWLASIFGTSKPVKKQVVLPALEHFDIQDKRKTNLTTGKAIDPNRDLLSGKYPYERVYNIVKAAKRYGIDPYDALAIDMQETGLGTRSDAQIGHTILRTRELVPTRLESDEASHDDPYDMYARSIATKMQYADKLGIKDPTLRLQVYNGLGKVFPETEQGYHGFKMDSIYGVPMPKEGIDLRKNPLYGKRVTDIRDNILRQNEQLGMYVRNIKKKGGAIVDPRGQWAHPGKDTIIPSGSITMEGVPYPVYGVDNTGYAQMMYPGMQYEFPGDMVYEKPLIKAQDGLNKKKTPSPISKVTASRGDNTKHAFNVPLTAEELKKLKDAEQFKQMQRNQTYVGPKGFTTEAEQGIHKRTQQVKEFKQNVVRPVLKGLDVTTDLMQLGNFIPHPIGQGIGKAGNVLGTMVDGYQAYNDYQDKNYTGAGINALSMALPAYLSMNSFRRNSKYLRPGQILYPFSPQAKAMPGAVNIPRVQYIEPFNSVRGMTDKNLLANRALLAGLNAEAAYDLKQDGGQMVYEKPLVKAQKGKQVPAPLIVNDPKHPRLKAYNDSLRLYNKGVADEQAYLNYVRSLGITPELGSYIPEKEKGKIVPERHISVSNRGSSGEGHAYATPSGNLKYLQDPLHNQVWKGYYRYTKPVQKVVYQKEVTPSTLYVDDLNHPRLQAYNDSLRLYNKGFKSEKEIQKELPVYTKLPSKEINTYPGPIKPVIGYGFDASKVTGDSYDYLMAHDEKGNPLPDKAAAAFMFKKPVQKVVYRKPEAEKVQPAPVAVPVAQPTNYFQGIPVYAPTPYDGSGAGAFVGYRDAKGKVVYVKPEDYQRMGVPKYGQEYIKKMTEQFEQGGEMIRRADGSYSRRGLWDNIRANKGSGKKPTKEMLEQERKIKAEEKKYGGQTNWLENYK